MKGLDVLWCLVGLFVFVNFFLVNIVVHEWGHYLAAENYGLEPEISFQFENLTSVEFSLEGMNIASTSFIDDGNSGHLSVIALVGPFFNLVLGMSFLVITILSKKRFIKEIMFVGFIVSVASFLMNMLPFSGSDGSLIFGQ